MKSWLPPLIAVTVIGLTFAYGAIDSLIVRFGKPADALVTHAWVSEGNDHVPKECNVSVNFQAAPGIAPNETVAVAPEMCAGFQENKSRIPVRFILIGESAWVAAAEDGGLKRGYRKLNLLILLVAGAATLFRRRA